MSSLSLKHIYKVYNGGVRAVNDFNLEIKDKSFVVLVGPSGCGKSTTLRMVAGLEEITSGQLYIDDECVNDVESKNRDIAMVFQSYALYPHMTVYQNMAFGLKLRHVKPEIIDEKVKKAAEILEISELLQRKPKELSGGQRQRVALGRAIVREPNVFLLDEPLSNLDAKLRVQMRTEITKLHETLQTTFIYVTHDQTEAMTMGDVIVVMKDGFIQQADEPIILFEDPTNLFVATFLGSPQMNIIECTLIKNGENVGADLGNSGTNIIWFKPETSKQILASKIDMSRTYLLGIRPDHISIDKKGIKAKVEVVEQLGDETLLYTKIANHDKYITVKLPLTGGIANGDDIFLNFSLDRLYLFDKESEHSIIGIPSYNKISSKLEKDVLRIGKTDVELPSDITSHLLYTKSCGNIVAGFKPEYASVEPASDSFELPVVVDFVEKRTKYNAVFAKVEGCDEYLVFRDKNKHENGEKLSIFVPFSQLKLFDGDGDSIICREEVLENMASVNVEKDKKNNTVIKFSNGSKLVYSDIDVEPGKYQFVLKEESSSVLFNRKIAKALNIDRIEAPSNQTLKVSCYDEEPIGKKNVIFAKIAGFSADYCTIVVPNNFSVYKMPKFAIAVPSNGFELIKE